MLAASENIGINPLDDPNAKLYALIFEKLLWLMVNES